MGRIAKIKKGKKRKIDKSLPIYIGNFLLRETAHLWQHVVANGSADLVIDRKQNQGIHPDGGKIEKSEYGLVKHGENGFVSYFVGTDGIMHLANTVYMFSHPE